MSTHPPATPREATANTAETRTAATASIQTGARRMTFDAVLTAQEMLALDEQTITDLGVSSPVLMERAALGVSRTLCERWPDASSVTVLCGPGNNGADGVAVARQLCQSGLSVTLVYSHARLNFAAQEQVRSAERLPLTILTFDRDKDRVQPSLGSADVWVDALLGVGASGCPRGRVAEALTLAHNCRTRRTRVLAVDVPTGVEVDTGEVHPRALRADVCVAIEHRKRCHVLPAGSEHCGSVFVHDIGLLPPSEGATRWANNAVARALWRPPSRAAHKGTRGHLLVIGGSTGTYGAALLCASAALRSGAGLVTIACPDPPAALVAARPELMWRERTDVLGELAQYDAVVLGPGAGVDDSAAACFNTWFHDAQRPPSVLDADALTWLATANHTLADGDILTPHPGELARLLGKTTRDVVANLPEAAAEARDRTGATVVAKTAGAWIHGQQTYSVGPGHPGMGTAGAGDVLAGITGAMLLRHPAQDAAVLGAWLHARAGASAGALRGSESLIASDIVDALPHAFFELARPA